MRIRRVNVDAAWEPSRIVRHWVDAIPHYRTGRCIRVVGDEHTPGTSRAPERTGIARRALDCRNSAAVAASPLCGIQPGRRHPIANHNEVTTPQFVGARCELGTVRFEIGLVPAPILRSPDAEGTLKDRATIRGMRVSDYRRIEKGRFWTTENRRGDDH